MPLHNLDRRLLPWVLGASLLSAPAARAAEDFPAAEQAQPITVDRLAAVHAAGGAYLRAAVGGQLAQQWLAAVADMPGGLHVVAACIGSFDRPGQSQALLGLVTADASRLMYAVFSPGAAPQVVWDEKPAPGRVAGTMPRFPSARCLSWTAVERLNARLRSAGVQDTVKRRSSMDAACVAPMTSDYEYLCYGWDTRRRRWERLGGWLQP